MDKKVMIAAFVCVLLVGITVFFQSGEIEESNFTAEASAKIEQKDIYEVVLEDEYIALYILTEKDKDLIKRKKASPLREKDREMLKQGIFTDNLQDALMLLEDFIS